MVGDEGHAVVPPSRVVRLWLELVLQSRPGPLRASPVPIMARELTDCLLVSSMITTRRASQKSTSAAPFGCESLEPGPVLPLATSQDHRGWSNNLLQANNHMILTTIVWHSPRQMETG